MLERTINYRKKKKKEETVLNCGKSEQREKKNIMLSKKSEIGTKESQRGWFVGFYGISTFVGNLTPNPFLCK